MPRQVEMRRYVGAFALVYLLAIAAAGAVSHGLGREEIPGYAGLVLVAVFAAADRFFADHGRRPGKAESRRFARGAALAVLPITAAGVLGYPLARHGQVVWDLVFGPLQGQPLAAWILFLALLASIALVVYAFAAVGIRWGFQWSVALRVRARQRRQRHRDGPVSP